MSGVEHKARRFCKLPCNNGWMSAMEGRTKPILTKLMLAKKLPIDLTADEQDQLAIWAYKTALVMDFNLEGLSDEKFISIRPSAYKRFYRSRVPPDRGVRVWTLPVRDPKAGLWWRRTQFSTYHKPIRRGKKTIPRSNLSVYLTTFGLHHSVIQVCGRLRGHAVLRFADTDPRLLQIFPRLTAKATWPGDGQTDRKHDRQVNDLLFPGRFNQLPGQRIADDGKRAAFPVGTTGMLRTYHTVKAAGWRQLSQSLRPFRPDHAVFETGVMRRFG